MFRFCGRCSYFNFDGVKVMCGKKRFTPLPITLIHPGYLVRQCLDIPARSYPYKYLYKASRNWLKRRKHALLLALQAK